MEESAQEVIANGDNDESNYEEGAEEVSKNDAVIESQRGSVHGTYQEFDGDDNEIDGFQEATWGEVYRQCCCHTITEWFYIFLALCCLLTTLYFFLVGLEFLSTSAKSLTGCMAASLFPDDTNPIVGLIIGILVTVLLQSSSTSTSVIVSLVGNGIDAKAAIYMVMGANIGTSVTNTIVAMGQMGNGDELERAFAAATVHDMFNFLSVLVLLPVEAITGYLYHLTYWMTSNYEANDSESWKSPIKTMVYPLVKPVIQSNKKLLTEVASNPSVTCNDIYPIVCDGEPTYDNCASESYLKNSTEQPVRFGLIKCDKDWGCPVFFQEDVDQGQDMSSAGFCLVLGLMILCVSLVVLVMLLKKMLMEVSVSVVYKATKMNGYVAMLVGCILTFLVQSSSVTTSTLTPLAGIGVLPLESMYPITLGANIGTTITGLLAALANGSRDAMQVALAHLFFNLSGIVIWYVIPIMRKVPMNAARGLGKATRIWKGFPCLYIVVCFFLIELIVLGLSAMCTSTNKGLQAFGILLSVVLGVLLVHYLIYWCCRGGKDSCTKYFARRQLLNDTYKALPETLESHHHELDRLKHHTELPEEEEKEDDEEEQPLCGEEECQESTVGFIKCWVKKTFRRFHRNTPTEEEEEDDKKNKTHEVTEEVNQEFGGQ